MECFPELGPQLRLTTARCLPGTSNNGLEKMTPGVDPLGVASSARASDAATTHETAANIRQDGIRIGMLGSPPRNDPTRYGHHAGKMAYPLEPSFAKLTRP